MKPVFKPLLIASLLATAGFAVVAESGGLGGAMHAGASMHHDAMDPTRMQEMMARRKAELKAILQLTAAQEGAWANYIAALQHPAGTAGRMSRENRQQMRDEMEALTTPQRIDRMNAIRAQRDSEMDQRGTATKVFYAALTPEQQKVFDANTLRHRPGAWRGARPGKAGTQS